MAERFRDNEKNSPYKRGMVKEIKGGRIKVQFTDEDETDSFWLNANQAGTGSNKSWSMPNVGEQVNCMVDWDGEDGCVLGSCWSDVDKAPTDDPNIEHSVYESGLEIIADRKNGNVTIKNFGSVSMEGNDLVIKANKIVLDAECHLGGEGGVPVSGVGHLDTANDKLTEGSSRVFVTS